MKDRIRIRLERLYIKLLKVADPDLGLKREGSGSSFMKDRIRIRLERLYIKLLKVAEI